MVLRILLGRRASTKIRKGRSDCIGEECEKKLVTSTAYVTFKLDVSVMEGAGTSVAVSDHRFQESKPVR